MDKLSGAPVPSQGPRLHALDGLLLHADDHLLVLDKPAGLLCVPGRGEDKQDCLSARVQAVFADARVVHRLDMATSGLVLMARGLPMQRALSKAFALRQVHKRYEAIVQGQLMPPKVHGEDSADAWHTIDLPLAVDWPNRPRSKVDLQRGKPSLTRWRWLAFDAQHPSTRVALEPLTGRTHQLRLHLQAIGHPIVGDALYGSAPITPGRDDESLGNESRLMLHATQLSLMHPHSGTPVQFDSAAPF